LFVSTIAVSLGDCCIDHYLAPIEKDFIGGSAVNVAIHMRRAGLPCACVGAVGNDRYGDLTLQALQGQNVDASHVQITTGPSKRANIRLTAHNEHEFIHEEHVPIPRLVLDDRTQAFVKRHQLVHTSWLGGAQDYLAAFKQAALLLSIDYGEGQNAAFIAETICLADLAFLSMPVEAEEQARQRAQELCRRGATLAVVTRGRQGSLTLYQGEFFTQPAYPVRVVDTLGAGDAFIGTFLHGWLEGLSTQDCLERASRAAAFTCTHLGGWYGAGIG
jgi:fructoselysine 6-kinase